MQLWLIMACLSNGTYTVLGQVSGDEDWALSYAQRTFGRHVWVEEDFK